MFLAAKSASAATAALGCAGYLLHTRLLRPDNLAALRLPPEARRFPRWIAVAGLVSCFGLASSSSGRSDSPAWRC